MPQGSLIRADKGIAPMLLYTLISVFSQLIDIVVMVVIVQFVLSLLIAFNVVNLHNKAVAAIWTALGAILDPMLNPIRRVMPNTGGIDFSPMILIFGLRILVQVLFFFASLATSV